MIEKHGRKFASSAELRRYEFQIEDNFLRTDRIKSSEQTAAVMFSECRSIFIVDNIDSQLTCVWFS